MKKKIISAALAAMMMLLCVPVLLSAETVAADATHLDMNTEVRYFGRTYEASGSHWFNWSGSGFTFTFKGESAKAKFVSSAPGGDNTAYIKIYVDGVEQPDVALTKQEQTVTLASGLDASKEHVITVRKRTNARSSSAGVSWISISDGGTKLTPAAAKTRYVEFIGDSLTVGYGSIGDGASAWSTGTEDVTKTYIPAICEALDADYGVIAVSGRGIARNYGGDTDKLIPYLYTKLDEYNNPGINWDYSIKPDVIVVNMGTNDEGCLGTNGFTKEEFIAKYEQFLKDLRAKLPDTKIVVTYGLTDRGLESPISDMVSSLVKAGFEGLSYVKCQTCKADEKNLGHPNQAGYAKNVTKLVDAINEVTGWNKTEDTAVADTTEAETAAPETEPEVSQTADSEPATEAPEDTVAEPQKSGCSSSAATAASALTAAVLAGAAVSKKRKRE